MEIYSDPPSENVTQKPTVPMAVRTPLVDVRNLAHSRFECQTTPKIDRAQPRRSKHMEPLICGSPVRQSITKDNACGMYNFTDFDVGTEVVIASSQAQESQPSLSLQFTKSDQEVEILKNEQYSQDSEKRAFSSNFLFVDHTYPTPNFGNDVKLNVIDRCVGADTDLFGINKCVGPDTHSSVCEITTKDVGTDVSSLSTVTDICVGTDLFWDEQSPSQVDVSMVTEDAQTLDCSVLAVPDFLSQETMTEANAVDTASSMTPFKLGKHGSRLTAEEVRRQHPRVVANQIDAVMLSNQRLEKQVKSLEKERTALKTALKESKSTLHDHDLLLTELKSSLEDKQQVLIRQESVLEEERMKCWNAEETLQSNRTEFNRKCEELERLQHEAELSFAEELKRIQAEAEEHSYKKQYESAQQKIRELQSEVEEYVHLAIELEEAHGLQGQLKKALGQLKSTACGLAKDKLQLESENESLKKSCVSREVDLDVLRFINQELLSDKEDMKELLCNSEKCITELDSSLKSANDAISQLQEELSLRLADIEALTEVKDELRKEKALMIIQLSEQQDSETVALQALENAEKELSKTEEVLAKERAILASGKEMHERMKMDFEEKALKLEMEVQHLEELLDKCELQRDAQEQELFESQEQLYTLQDMKATFETTTSEVNSGVAGLQKLQEQMEALLLTLNGKINDCKPKSQPSYLRSSTPKNKKHSRKSFVAEVLANVSQNQPLDLSSSICPRELSFNAIGYKQQSNVEFGAACVKSGVAAAALLSPASLSFCGVASNRKNPAAVPGSSQKSVSFHDPPGSRRALFSNSVAEPKVLCDQLSSLESTSTMMAATGQNKHNTTPGFAKIKSIPLTTGISQESDSDESDQTKSSDKISPTSTRCSYLTDKVQVVAGLFNQIMKTVELVERRADLIIKDGQEELEYVKEQLKHKKTMSKELQMELEKKSASLHVVNSRQKELQIRVSEMTASLLNFHDQSLQISRLEEEKRDMKWKIADLEGQCSLLSDHLEAHVKKLDAAMAGQACYDGISGQEVLALKRENHALMVKLQEEQEEHRDIWDKAVKRMKLLESNWKKAENEVRRLDELIEDVREGCVSSQAQRTHPLILDIVRVIDGKLPSLSKSSQV